MDKILGIRLASPNQYAKWISLTNTKQDFVKKKRQDWYDD